MYFEYQGYLEFSKIKASEKEKNYMSHEPQSISFKISRLNIYFLSVLIKNDIYKMFFNY